MEQNIMSSTSGHNGEEFSPESLSEEALHTVTGGGPGAAIGGVVGAGGGVAGVYGFGKATGLNTKDSLTLAGETALPAAVAGGAWGGVTGIGVEKGVGKVIKSVKGVK